MQTRMILSYSRKVHIRVSSRQLSGIEVQFQQEWLRRGPVPTSTLNGPLLQDTMAQVYTARTVTHCRICTGLVSTRLTWSIRTPRSTRLLLLLRIFHANRTPSMRPLYQYRHRTLDNTRWLAQRCRGQVGLMQVSDWVCLTRPRPPPTCRHSLARYRHLLDQPLTPVR